VTQQNVLFLVKLEKLSFQLNLEQKLFDLGFDHSASSRFAWHTHTQTLGRTLRWHYRGRFCFGLRGKIAVLLKLVISVVFDRLMLKRFLTQPTSLWPLFSRIQQPIHHRKLIMTEETDVVKHNTRGHEFYMTLQNGISSLLLSLLHCWWRVICQSQRSNESQAKFTKWTKVNKWECDKIHVKFVQFNTKQFLFLNLNYNSLEVVFEVELLNYAIILKQLNSFKSAWSFLFRRKSSPAVRMG